MIACIIEDGNGGSHTWTVDDPYLLPCPFRVEDLDASPRVTLFSEDHLVVLCQNAVFISDLVGPQTQLISVGIEDRVVLCAMILCALNPDGETDWDYERFEEVIDRLDLIRFVP